MVTHLALGTLPVLKIRVDFEVRLSMIISIKIRGIDSQILLTIYNYIVTYFKAPSRKNFSLNNRSDLRCSFLNFLIGITTWTRIKISFKFEFPAACRRSRLSGGAGWNPMKDKNPKACLWEFYNIVTQFYFWFYPDKNPLGLHQNQMVCR